MVDGIFLHPFPALHTPSSPPRVLFFLSEPTPLILFLIFDPLSGFFFDSFHVFPRDLLPSLFFFFFFLCTLAFFKFDILVTPRELVPSPAPHQAEESREVPVPRGRTSSRVVSFVFFLFLSVTPQVSNLSFTQPLCAFVGSLSKPVYFRFFLRSPPRFCGLLGARCTV